MGDKDEAQGLRHARFLHSAPHPGPDTVGEDGREVESLTSKLVARGLILPTNLSKRINFHMHIALLMLTRVPSVCSANSAWRKIG